ncbi:hypothetical protein RhiirA5_354138 [Rhizophagus irregularis]|nr:hypothetical protein RhiirA5_354138 [Rhizophagus irregularis]PKC71388.1 hypothetical protein RhiirA1_413240 [Rhizophagus irregularis]PKY20331.1 hypothetical protein RhiirB3_408139 [Rhizophagus irregularis]
MCAKRGKNEAITQPFGTWQVDRSATKEVNGILPKLGIYDFHFQFNNKSSDKKLKSFETEIIQWRRCISCNNYVTFFHGKKGALSVLGI